MKRKSYFSAEIKGNPLRCPSRNRSGKHRRVSYVSPFYQHVFVLLHPYDCADFLALSGSDSAAQGNTSLGTGALQNNTTGILNTARHAHFETVAARPDALELRNNHSIQITAEKTSSTR